MGGTFGEKGDGFAFAEQMATEGENPDVSTGAARIVSCLVDGNGAESPKDFCQKAAVKHGPRGQKTHPSGHHGGNDQHIHDGAGMIAGNDDGTGGGDSPPLDDFDLLEEELQSGPD
jgi:hypothetical protein